MNNKGFAISSIIYAILILFLIIIFGILSILGARKLTIDKLKNDIADELNGEIFELTYRDRSGANKPELLENMVPIKYDGTNWVYADIYEEWYDYDFKEWANAVVLNNGVTKSVGQTISESEIALWYVWIPRYTYTIFNGNNGSSNPTTIEIKFESGTKSTGSVICEDVDFKSNPTSEVSEICTDIVNGEIINGTSTYTHPAFTFGDEELTGFWVGKFEVSGTIDMITIKPNVSSLRNENVSSFFTSIQNMSSIYKLNGDSHMMKNMEWGAVAYLSHSKYGINEEVGINNNSSYIIGCGAIAGSGSSSSCNTYDTTNGMLASTTGNIYGVYDMSGGSWEYVMGNMVNSSGLFYSINAGFSEVLDAKYYDSYTYNTSNTTHGRGKLGDATKETLSTFGNASGGWYSNYTYFPTSNYSWFCRGGRYSSNVNASVFYFSSYNGGAYSDWSTRAVLVK